MELIVMTNKFTGDLNDNQYFYTSYTILIIKFSNVTANHPCRQETPPHAIYLTYSI